MPETPPETATEIRLTNTATRREEPFVPLDPANVRMYVCGPTVYDRAHLGNARSAVVFDVLFRLLRHVHGAEHVTYVRNVTDIDDKIIARAHETGRSVEAVTGETTRWYHEDMDALGCLRPTHEPRATEYLPQMIAMISALIEGGHAYEAEGHVLFSVSSYPAYGALSGRSVEDMIAGSRVEVAPYKRDPMDFVLWKPSGEGVPGWPSPWGRGRPGWHIECSAMARDLLGGRFDLHGGGLDLQFPHHENEIAQSRCAHPDEGFARVWIHHEMLMVEGRKMSKSLGNFFTVRDLLDRGVPGEVIRLVLLGAHYGKPMDWSERKVEEASAVLKRWRGGTADPTAAGLDLAFVSLLADDLNTAGAIARLHEVAEGPRFEAARAGLAFLGVPGAWDTAPSAKTARRGVEGGSSGPSDPVDTAVARLLEARDEAKAARDFARADAIRAGLAKAGVTVRDTPSGSEWEREAAVDPSELEAIL